MADLRETGKLPRLFDIHDCVGEMTRLTGLC